MPSTGFVSLRPLYALYRINFCTQSEYFTIYNRVFNFNIPAIVLSEILGSPKFTLEGLTPVDTRQRRNFCTQSEYFTISHCVFTFNILGLVVSEILGGSEIYVRKPCAPLYAP